MNMRDRIAMWCSGTGKSPQGLQSPAVFFGTMCKGEHQALEEGRMIPSWSMCSNSCLAARSWSGARRLERAETGAPAVSI